VVGGETAAMAVDDGTAAAAAVDGGEDGENAVHVVAAAA